MKDAKEFHGKTLDEAIKAACQFYGVQREKLEIEIVNDSKMGIFGLVNVKKACVRASLANTDSILEGLTETLSQPEPQAPKGRRGQAPKTEKPKAAKASPKSAPKGTSKPAGAPVHESSQSPQAPQVPQPMGEKTAEVSGATPDVDGNQVAQAQSGKETRAPKEVKASSDESAPNSAAKSRGKKTESGETAEDDKGKSTGRSSRKERAPKQENRSRRGRGADRKAGDADAGVDADDNGSGEGFSLADLEAFNQDELQSIIHDVVNRLVSSIIGEVPLTIAIDEGHIRVKVDCEEDARILVGREGQTLASVQYIASRILASKLQGAVRLHIDTGNYKENQDARLTGLALMLAEKLRKSGRTQSTRPLSAYQRRIVHLALENEEDIQTSSKGDGPQRRVLIHFKRNRNQKNAPQVEQEQDSGKEGEAQGSYENLDAQTPQSLDASAELAPVANAVDRLVDEPVDLEVSEEADKQA